MREQSAIDSLLFRACVNGGFTDLYEAARDELAALRKSVAEFEQERDMLSVDAKMCEKYRQRLHDLRIMLGCSINDLPVKVKSLTNRVSELERMQSAFCNSDAQNCETLSKRIDAFLDANLPQIVTPNNCRHCQRAAEKMREAAAELLDAKILTDEEVEDGIDWSQNAPQRWATDIRALPLPACDGCNPLAPSQSCNDVLHKCAVCGKDADGPFYCADCK